MTDLRDAGAATPTDEATPALSEAQLQHFEDFGFLVLRGWMVEDLPWIESEFEAAFADESVRPDRPAAKHLAPFIDQRERLACLLEHPRVDAIATGLLGEDWNYQAGDGNLYAGETPWHRDGVWQHGRFIKVAMYLDPVDGDSGALRVVPGSHRVGADLEGSWLVPFAPEAYGLAPHEVPSVPLASTPGDVVVFSHRLLHASFGGGQRRRMFTMNLSSRARTPEQVADLQAFIALHCNQLMDRMHGEIMLSTATPGRWRHLEQVIEHEGVLAPLTRERRAQPVTIGRL